MIRKANLKDVQIILDLWKDYIKYHKDVVKVNPKFKHLMMKKKNAVNEYKKIVKKYIMSKDSRVFVAEVDGKIAGYSLVKIKKNIPIFRLEKVGYMRDLFVKKKFRNLGISSMLKNESVKWLRNRGIKYVSLHLYKENKFAYSIYRKWGFFDFQLDMRKRI